VPWYSSFPSTFALGTRSFMRFMHRRNVDFPHPEGLIRAVIDRSGISSVMPLTASAVPYDTERSSMSKTTSLLVGTLVGAPVVATEASDGTAGVSERGGSTTLTRGVSVAGIPAGVHMM